MQAVNQHMPGMEPLFTTGPLQAVNQHMPGMVPLFTTGPLQAVNEHMPGMVPLFTTGPYDLYPLHVCSADAIAKLFVKVCARGNPILQGKSAADLYQLGVAFYNKSLGSVMSLVFMKGAEPVALMFGWDTFHGGVWKGTSGPPEALACHAAIGTAIFASRPHQITAPGLEMFMAFAGVALPHPGQTLLLSMQIMALFSAAAAGYVDSFGFAVHAKTIEQSQSNPGEVGFRNVWRLSYCDIEVADETVQEELCSIYPGAAECSVTNIAFSIDGLSEATAQVQELAEGCRPGVARMLASTHMPFNDHGFQMPMARL